MSSPPRGRFRHHSHHRFRRLRRRRRHHHHHRYRPWRTLRSPGKSLLDRSSLAGRHWHSTLVPRACICKYSQKVPRRL